MRGRSKIYWLSFALWWIVIWSATVLANRCSAQIYSASASKEIAQIVQKETPVVTKDTVKIADAFDFPSLYVIRHSLTYPKAVLMIIRSPEGDWKLRAYTRQGQQVILRPEDEYAILEKILAK